MAASFRFVHAADLHLDTPFEGVAGPAPAVAEALRDASLQAWDNVVRVALESGAQLLFLAGDIYDGAHRGLRAQLRFLSGLKRLSDAGVRVFIVHGNHDPLEGWSAIREWPPGVHVFGCGEVETVTVQLDAPIGAQTPGRAGGDRAAADGGPSGAANQGACNVRSPASGSVCVHGISYRTRETREALARRFSRVAGGSSGAGRVASQLPPSGTLFAHADEAEADPPRSQGDTDPAAFHVGLLHTNVGGSPEHGDYAPCSLTDLQAAGMDYWALGHIHKRQILRDGAPWIVYPGDTQGRSPKPSETGAKGVYVGEVARGMVTSLDFRPVDVVRFVTCQVDVADVIDVPAVQARIGAGIEALRDEHAGRALLVRVVLQGRGAVAADLRPEGALAGLVTELRSGYEGLSPFVWIESIKDRSRSTLDRDALRRRGDFAAELLRLADGLTDVDETRASFVDDAAGLLGGGGRVAQALRDAEAAADGSAGLGDARTPTSAERSVAVLDEAVELALDMLERETTE